MSAVISDCQRYRYLLTRGGGGRKVCFVMLNPSTADAGTDDPTVRRCVGFMNRWGFDRMEIVNLYGLRSTDPKALLSSPDPVGPDNEMHQRRALKGADLVVCAWGAHAGRNEVEGFRELAKRLGVDLYALGFTRSGQPRHPLYLKAATIPLHWF